MARMKLFDFFGLVCGDELGKKELYTFRLTLSYGTLFQSLLGEQNPLKIRKGCQVALKDVGKHSLILRPCVLDKAKKAMVGGR